MTVPQRTLPYAPCVHLAKLGTGGNGWLKDLVGPECARLHEAQENAAVLGAVEWVQPFNSTGRDVVPVAVHNGQLGPVLQGRRHRCVPLSQRLGLATISTSSAG